MNPIVIGVAGGSGSGKTTVANHIKNALDEDVVAYLPQDAYYVYLPDLTHEQRLAFNYDHPDAFETRRLIHHIRQLKAGRPINLPRYNFTTYLREEETLPINAKPLILVEGILILTDPELRSLMDMKIYVDTDSDVRFIRRLTRDMAERGRTQQQVIEQYMETVRPMHIQFVEPSRRFADIIIPWGGENEIAVDMILGRLQTMLGR